MTLVEALKSGHAIRRPIARHMGSHGDGWINPKFYISLLCGSHSINMISLVWPQPEDVLADDWEVKLEIPGEISGC